MIVRRIHLFPPLGFDISQRNEPTPIRASALQDCAPLTAKLNKIDFHEMFLANLRRSFGASHTLTPPGAHGAAFVC
jgi:hypothetical protein